MKEYEVIGYDGEGAFRFFVGVCLFLLAFGFRAVFTLTPDDSTNKPIALNKKEADYQPRICVTGKIEGLSRKEIVQQLDDIGYKYVKTIDNRIEFLVVGEKPGPSKMKKAETIDVEIVSADDFIEWLAAAKHLG